MPNYKPYNYNQSSMIVINYQDQLQPGTFEHALHHLIDKQIDLWQIRLMERQKIVIEKWTPRMRVFLQPRYESRS